jgi:hypothetical protein
MNQQNFFLTIFVGAVMALATGCDDSGTAAPTSTATGTSTSTSTGTGTGVLLKADSGGFVAADSNSLGVQGPWFAYGDNLGDNGMPPGKCQTVGMHTAAECAEVTTPGMPFAPSDATDDQKMCTTGRVENVLMLGAAMDYDNMFGAGIGFEFNNPGMGAVKGSFDAAAKNVIGVSFDIDAPPPAGIRVEFPDAVTNGKSAAYYGAVGTSYPKSPLKSGPNTIYWADVTSPEPAKVPMLDKTKLIGVQFHVPSGTAGPYSFCISHFKMLQ